MIWAILSAILALMCGMSGVSPAVAAVQPATIDFQAPVTSSATGSAFDDEPRLNAPSPAAPASSAAASKALSKTLSGNPLWGIPLSSLKAARERPLFSPTRRPPAVNVPVAVQPAVPQAPPPVIPDHPRLTLLGTVAGDNEKIAVFIDATTNNVVRLRLGQAHSAWVLQSVEGRSVIMQKGPATETLVLQKQGGQAVRASAQPPNITPQAGSPTYLGDEAAPSGIDMR